MILKMNTVINMKTLLEEKIAHIYELAAMRGDSANIDN
jgi:hypothetical protein